MVRKRRFDKHILKLLEEYRGILLPYNILRQELENQGYHVTDPTLSANLKHLRDDNKVWYVQAYGLPAKSADGLWFSIKPLEAIVVNQAEVMGDVWKLFKLQNIGVYTWEDAKEPLTTIRDEMIKKGLPKNIKSELRQWLEDVKSGLVRRYPCLPMVDTAIKRGYMTVEESADVMELPVGSFEDILRDYRDTQKLRGGEEDTN